MFWDTCANITKHTHSTKDGWFSLQSEHSPLYIFKENLPPLSHRISPSKRCPFMHFLNAVIGLIYRCVWFYTTSAPRCGQKRWRNVARSVSHRGLLMTVIQRQEGLENGRGLICFSAAEHQPLSSPGLFAFYVQLFRWKKNSPGKGWNR